MKPHGLDQVVDWIRTIEEVRYDYIPCVISQNFSNNFYVEEDQMTVQASEEDAPKCEKLVDDCCHFTSSTCVDPYNSAEDEDTQFEDKEVVHDYCTQDVLDCEKILGVQEEAPLPNLIVENGAYVVNVVS